MRDIRPGSGTKVVFDATNSTRTSSRRLDEGLLSTSVTFLYYYLLGYALNRTFRRPVLCTAPPFRRSGDRGVQVLDPAAFVASATRWC